MDLWPLVNLLALSSALFGLSLFIFVMPGLLLLERRLAKRYGLQELERDLGSGTYLNVAIHLGFIVCGVLTSIGVILGVANSLLGIIFITISFVALSLSLRNGGWRIFFKREIWPGLLVFYLFYLLVMVGASFPILDPKSVSGAQVLWLTSLPVDNSLPYLFSRYLVERFPPAGIDIFPTWGATDRVPLAGILNATIFMVLNLKDTTPWLNGAPGLYFVYQAVQVFLNGLALFGVWSIARERFGERAAICALLLLVSTYFFYQNILFTWPKFVMAFSVLVGFELWFRSRHKLLAGFIVGTGALLHNSASFYVVSFLLYVSMFAAFRLLRGRTYRWAILIGEARPIMQFVVGYAALMLPWALYKQFEPASPRLFYMHVMCNLSYDLSSLTPLGELQRYLSSHSLSELIAIRWSNLSHPFQVSRPLSLLVQSWPNYYLALQQVSTDAFFIFVWSVGLITFAFFLKSLWLLRRATDVRHFADTVAVAFGALLVASAIFGCPSWTHSHHWAYPAFLVVIILAGRTVARGGLLTLSLFALAISVNLLWLVMKSYFQEYIRVYFHASSLYVWSQAALLSAIVVGLLLSLVLVGRGQGGSSEVREH